MLSLPVPPAIVSLPNPPYSESFPAPPISQFALLSPVSTSFRVEPRIPSTVASTMVSPDASPVLVCNATDRLTVTAAAEAE